jgi:hypothetical protein
MTEAETKAGGKGKGKEKADEGESRRKRKRGADAEPEPEWVGRIERRLEGLEKMVREEIRKVKERIDELWESDGDKDADGDAVEDVEMKE